MPLQELKSRQKREELKEWDGLIQNNTWGKKNKKYHQKIAKDARIKFNKII